MRRVLCAVIGIVLLFPALSLAADAPVPTAAVTAPVAGAAQRKIDVNRATLSELIGVPGIGPSTAQAIVDARSKKGAFAKLEELIEVKGIGEKKLAALSEYLAVVPSPAPPISSTTTVR